MINRTCSVMCVLIAVTAGAGMLAARPTRLTTHEIAGQQRATVEQASDPHAEVRGMTISCHGWGAAWASDEMVDAMADLKSLGVNWVTIHPYASIRGNGEVVMSDRAYGDTRWLTRPIEEAHKLGLKIMIKPHIAYWGSRFSWRGAITFDTDEHWNTFFDSYQRWIVRVAELSRAADAFVVGTELDRTVHHADRWKSIIAAVGTQMDCPLTYAANWDRYDSVPFWSSLNCIGIQGYFPLAAVDQKPTAQSLAASWKTIIERLEAFSRELNRPIVLTELGYDQASTAATEPWSSDRRNRDARHAALQSSCLEAALQTIGKSQAVRGAFLWKWFPSGARGASHLKSTPSMRKVIAENWRPETAASGNHAAAQDATDREPAGSAG